MPNKSKLQQNNKLIPIIKNKILDILNITNNKNYFYLPDIDENIDIQNKIIELGDECSQYFSISNWTYFRNKKNNKLNSRSYLTLLKNILKFCNIKYINKQTSKIENNKIVYLMKYYIII